MREIFYVHHSNYINLGVKTSIGNKGIRTRWPTYIPDSSVEDLSKNFDAVSYTSTLNDTSTSIVEAMEKSSRERGITSYPRDHVKEC